MDIKQKFYARCSMKDTVDCIQWLGNVDKKGYGRIHLTDKSVKAHRISYCIHHGIDIDSIGNLVVMHACDNPSCVNPRHLSVGDYADNNKDRSKKGRSACGEMNGFSKLTDEQVEYIKNSYVKNSRAFGSVALGAIYGVCHTTISKIVNGKSRTYAAKIRNTGTWLKDSNVNGGKRQGGE